MDLHFDSPGRNAYPDFCLVNLAEGFELKGLANPGREANFGRNSRIPLAEHNGRQIYFVFGRYPSDPDGDRYPSLNLVVLLNADTAYFHANKSLPVFGSYGDILIRDSKMYVKPTPFALVQGTARRSTLILRDDHLVDDSLFPVSTLTRRETDRIVVAYSFDLRTNEIVTADAPNPNAGRNHVFRAYRIKGVPAGPVSFWVH